MSYFYSKVIEYIYILKEGNTMHDLFDRKKDYYNTHITHPYRYRIDALDRLYDAILKYQDMICEALYKDLRKSEPESYLTEIGYTLNAISHTKKYLKKWMKPQTKKPSVQSLTSKHVVIAQPRGVVLIIAPFNYPFQLVFTPLIAALAAGNCATIKVSEMCPHIADVVEDIVQDVFDPMYVDVVSGDKEVTGELLKLDFDHIFFTGSPNVGKIVMKAASQRLIPVTLELGGKSPVIVDATANLEQAAFQIVWGKMMNASQTCIAPDYLLVENSVKDALLKQIIISKEMLYGVDESTCEDFSRIVSVQHSIRLQNIIEQDKDSILYGGQCDTQERFVSFTLVDVKDERAACMQEEMFGPILGVIGYDTSDEIVSWIQKNPAPLAVYAYTKSNLMIDLVTNKLAFGGGCINTMFSHVTAHSLPFGGIKNSGIGNYHGEYGFQTFTHQKAMVIAKATKPNMLMFPPYTHKMKWIKKFFK